MFQHAVPGPILAAIGDVTVSFSAVEHILGMLVWSRFSDHQRVGQIVTAELSFRATRALLVSLYVERHGDDDPHLPRLKELMARADRLEQRRNQIVHSTWGAGPTPDSVIRFKQVAKEKAGWKASSETLTMQDIGAIAADLRGLASDLMALHLALLEAGKATNNSLSPK